MRTFMSEDRMLRYKMYFYGYETGRIPLKFDDELKKIARVVMNLPEITTVKGFKCNTDDVVGKAKDILERHFDLHDVPHISCSDFALVMDGLVDKEDNTLDMSKSDEIIKQMEDKAEVISPFDLDVNYVEGYSFLGQILKTIPYVANEDFMREFPVAYNGINLGNNVSLISSAIYGHEIIHSQIETRKGTCLDYRNNEVLSIFGEKLIAFELDPSGELLKQQDKMRFRYMFEMLAILNSSDKFSKTELVNASAYVVSTLQATHLFDKYINGDVGTQTDILTGIQNVFDGRCTVEEVLESVDVNYDNSKDAALVKKYI